MDECSLKDPFPFTTSQFHVVADDSFNDPTASDAVTWIHSQSSQLRKLRQKASLQPTHPPEESVLHTLLSEPSKPTPASASANTSHKSRSLKRNGSKTAVISIAPKKQIHQGDSNPWGGAIESIVFQCQSRASMRTIEKKSPHTKLTESLTEKLASHGCALARVSRTSCEDLLDPPNDPTTSVGIEVPKEINHLPADPAPKSVKRTSTADLKMYEGDTEHLPCPPCEGVTLGRDNKAKPPLSRPLGPPPLPASKEPLASKPQAQPKPSLQSHRPPSLKRHNTTLERNADPPTKAKENQVVARPSKVLQHVPPPDSSLTLTSLVHPPSQPLRASQPNGRPIPPLLGMRRVRTYGPGGNADLPYSQSQSLPTKQKGFKTPFARTPPVAPPDVPVGGIIAAKSAVPVRTRSAIYPSHVPYIAPVRDPYSPSTATSADVDMDDRGSSPAPDADSSFGEIELPLDMEALDELMKAYD